MKKILYLMVLAAVMPLLTLSCADGGYADEREVPLCFSVDTLSFDTLFTTVDSATRQVVVYNATGNDATFTPVVFPLIAGAGSFTTLLSIRSQYSDFNIFHKTTSHRQ